MDLTDTITGLEGSLNGLPGPVGGLAGSMDTYSPGADVPAELVPASLESREGKGVSGWILGIRYFLDMREVRPLQRCSRDGELSSTLCAG